MNDPAACLPVGKQAAGYELHFVDASYILGENASLKIDEHQKEIYIKPIDQLKKPRTPKRDARPMRN